MTTPACGVTLNCLQHLSSCTESTCMLQQYSMLSLAACLRSVSVSATAAAQTHLCCMRVGFSSTREPRHNEHMAVCSDDCTHPYGLLLTIPKQQRRRCMRCWQACRGHSVAPSEQGGADSVEGHLQGLALQDLPGQPPQVLGQCGPLAHLALRPLQVLRQAAKQGEPHTLPS